MLLLDSVVPEEWYSVKQVSGILGRGVDAVRDRIYDGHLHGFIKPGTSSKRRRIYRGVRVQGCEIIRFVKAHMTEDKRKKRDSPLMRRGFSL
jgi:hypothetical protein